MTIESKTFRGTQPPAERNPNERLAVKSLNEWRNANPTAKIISIETLIESSNQSKLKFDGVRVWFELN